MNGQHRKDIRPGLQVEIVTKQDQRSGRSTRGLVKDMLTNASHHPHGITGRLETGAGGRVHAMVDCSRQPRGGCQEACEDPLAV